MIPRDNRIFIAAVLTLVIILAIGYVVFGDDKEIMSELPVPHLPHLKEKQGDK